MPQTYQMLQRSKIKLKKSELPFDPCPSTPNCYIDRYLVRNEIQSVMSAVEIALQQLRPRKITRIENGFDCEFRVFLFIDDVLVRVIEGADGVSIWIRSSSRIGESDLGVNKRRVNRFHKHLKSTLR